MVDLDGLMNELLGAGLVIAQDAAIGCSVLEQSRAGASLAKMPLQVYEITRLKEALLMQPADVELWHVLDFSGSPTVGFRNHLRNYAKLAFNHDYHADIERQYST